MRRDQDDDSDDEAYDPTAFVPAAPASASVAASTHNSIGTTSAFAQGAAPRPPSVSSSVAAPSASPVGGAAMGGSDGSGGAFPFLHRLRMPHVAPLSAIALQPHGGAILCVGNHEGSLFMFDFRNDGSASGDATSAAVRGGGRGGAVAATPKATPNPLAPTRTMTPFPSAHGRNHAITSLTFLADGAHFIAGHEGDHAMAIDSNNGRQLDRTAVGSRGVLDTVRQVGHKAAVTCVSPVVGGGGGVASSFCTASLDGTVRLWDVRTMKRHSTYAAKHGQSATDTLTETTPLYACAAIRPTLLASAGGDGVVQVWDTLTPFRPSKSAMTFPPVLPYGAGGAGVGASAAAISIGALLRIDDVRLAFRCSDGRVGFMDLRQCGAGAVSFAQGGAPSFSYRGDTSSMVLHTHPATGIETILMTTMERSRGGAGVSGGGGRCLVELSLDAAATGRMLRAEPIAGAPDRRRGGGAAAVKSPADDFAAQSSSLSCGVASDPVHDQLFVFGDDSSDVQLRNAAMRQLAVGGGLSPVQQWFGRSGRSGSKREREEAHTAGGRSGGGAKSTATTTSKMPNDDELFLF